MFGLTRQGRRCCSRDLRGDASYIVRVNPDRYLLSAGRRACRRVCWGGAGECSCGAPAAARLLPARVWRADARGLTRWSHRMKASAGSTRPTQSPSTTAGGKHHRGETAHGETHPPTTTSFSSSVGQRNTAVTLGHAQIILYK